MNKNEAQGDNNMRLELELENYTNQVKRWPNEGRHIMAQYTKDYVIAYQAFMPAIAEYAVQHQRFGGSHYNLNRTSWIKTNFMWMMFRSGWATKPNQERILAIYIKADGFIEILRNAYTVQKEKEMGVKREDVQVRLQWDPDHDPTGEKMPRRAMQLGLKPKILTKFNDDWILGIRDITDMVREQQSFVEEKQLCDLMVPKETVYLPSDELLCEQVL